MRCSAFLRKGLFVAVAATAFIALGFGTARQAEAQSWGASVGYRFRPNRSGFYSPYPQSYYSGYRFAQPSAPVYHAPSVHYDHVYHHEYSHWTPGRGLHSHGHYDAVPHYVPGHFDRWHGNHIDLNPHFHD